MHTTEEIMEILKSVIRMNIAEIEENNYCGCDDYYNGMAQGLRMAIDKIEKSEFLWK